MASCCNESMLKFGWFDLGGGTAPQKSDGDIGWDLRCISDDSFRNIYSGDFLGDHSIYEDCFELSTGSRHVFSTGIALELPQGYHAIVKPRSGLAVKHGINVLAGVIDNSYRGHLVVCLQNNGSKTVRICAGDKIAQMVIVKENEGTFTKVKKLSETARGAKGLGSSGR